MTKIKSFSAIDFETAQGLRHSICAVGLVRVENGEITSTLELLVKPPENYYFWKNTEIHGIGPEMTKRSPTFDKVWPALKPFIYGQNVVAHNGAFDFDVLEKTLRHYCIEPPKFNRYCTYRIYGSALDVCCDEHCIELDHHNALSDAMACAKLFQMYIDKN